MPGPLMRVLIVVFKVRIYKQWTRFCQRDDADSKYSIENECNY
jgi:hypothetical protein